MIEAPHYSATGAKKKSVSLPAALFDGTVNEHALHRAVVTFLANQRQGTHDTKTRRWVTGGNQKPWRQKGTGRARQGSIRAPHWRHGGIAFRPPPPDHRGGPAGRRDGGLRCVSCITPSWRPWSPRNRRRPMGRARSTRFGCTRKRPNRRSGGRSSRSSRAV